MRVQTGARLMGHEALDEIYVQLDERLRDGAAAE